MSYILDALKKSEQARGNRRTRGLIQGPVEITVIPSTLPTESSPRWPYVVALILLLNAGLLAFWLRPWQGGENANVSSSRISGGQFQETRRQEAPVIPPAPKPPATDAATAVSAGPPVSGTQTHETVQDQIGENKIPLKDQEAIQSLKTEPAQYPPTPTDVSRQDEVAIKKPDGPKPPQNPKAAGTKKGLKTADWEAARKHQAMPVEQRRLPAAASGIISDIQPLAELGASSGKPATPQAPKWHDLAPQIRDALPNLSVSMLIYSKKPEDRRIYINGSKKQQGEEISAGLKLEEITPDGAIFSYQGHRFYKGVVGD